MNTVPSPESLSPQPPAAAQLRPVLLVAAAMLLPLLVYFGTARSLVEIWQRSETFAHGFVILPLALWLVWRERAALAALAPRPCWPALAALAGCSALWLLGELVGAGIVRQYALAAMLPLSVLCVLGWRIAWALLFPLCFVLFAVPVGEGLIPPLIDLTADFTVDALRLTGIPVLRDGNNFSIPSGNWSVVEACSGLRYLVSSVTLGCLFAYLSYRSAWRRALFVLAAILVPLLANGVRAYLIVMIGHWSGMTMAVGVDHLIYGWVFFGIVMLLLFWVGSYWREDLAPAPAAGPAAHPAALAVRPLAAAALAAIAVLALGPVLAARLTGTAAADAAPLPATLALPAPPAAAFSSYEPDFLPASGGVRQFHQASQPVGLTVLFYRDEGGANKLISSANRLGRERSEFRENSVTLRSEQVAGRSLQVREGLLGLEGRRLLVWQWYAIGGRNTSNNYVGKLLQVKEKMITGSGQGAAVMVFSAYDEDPAAARAVLREFLNSNLAPLEAALASHSSSTP